MRVLVACEFSGTVRNAFQSKGHDAWSCDLLSTESKGNHYQCDIRKIIDKNWDLMIAHPPCTHLSSSGARWFPKKKKQQLKALELFLFLLNSSIPMIAIENPIGIVSSRICRPTQIIHPWQFGHSCRKTTCLWLKNLPKLKPTKIVDKGEQVTFPSGVKMPKWYSEIPSNENRGKARSITFLGIAEAMANQWSKPVLSGFDFEVPYKLRSI